MISDYAYCLSDLQILRVGSYNIKKQINLSELNTTFKKIQNIHVLGLQEVSIGLNYNEKTNFPLIPDTEKIWPYQCLYKTNIDNDHRYEGQGIFSQFPIISCGHFNLESTDTKKRIAQWAVINVSKNKKILFINTDHETNNRLTLGFPDRKKQILSLLDNIQNCHQSVVPDCLNMPIVIVGDFNTIGISFSSPLETLNEVFKTEDMMKKNNFQRIAPCPNKKNTFHSLLGNFELDHIFIYKTKNESCRHAEYDYFGSDHSPIWSLIGI